MNALPAQARYTWGGDEFLFVEIDEQMSLAACLRAMDIARRLQGERPRGVVDICPANASLLIRFDPDVLEPAALEDLVRGLEAAASSAGETTLDTRIVEVPVWYDDPHTRETAARFRQGYHQRESGTDIDFAAEANGLSGSAECIARHHGQPWIVSMVGFVAGLPFLYQLVDRASQLQVPKYLSPRTDTPKLTVGHGGCFGCIYSVRGAGGYQMFGLAAAPVFDPSQTLADFADSMVFFRPGDIVRFVPVDQERYDQIQTEADAGTFRYRVAPVRFDTHEALADHEGHNRKLLEALYG